MNAQEYQEYISTFERYRAAVKRIVNLSKDDNIKKALLYCLKEFPKIREDIDIQDIVFEIIKIDYPEYYDAVKKLLPLI